MGDIPQYAFVLPDDETKQRMRAIEKQFAALTERQFQYAWHCICSWGLKSGCEGRAFLSALNRAAKKARNNLP